jgi:hypothetical protein
MVVPDTVSMDDLLNDARKLMDTAASCVERGLGGEDWTIYYGPEGGLRMVVGAAECLESVLSTRGAERVWQVRHFPGAVRVDGRAGLELCQLERPAKGPGVRALVSDVRLYEMVA